MNENYTHWRQFPNLVAVTDCDEEWWPNIAPETQYRWLRSRYLDRDYLGADGEGAGVYRYTYYLGHVDFRRYDLSWAVPHVIANWGGLDVIRRLLREQAGLMPGVAVPEDTSQLPPGLWSSMGGEDQKFWYDALTKAARQNNMESVRFYVEELGVPPFLFPFPKLPREDTRERWAAMVEEAREEEEDGLSWDEPILSPLEATFFGQSVEAAQYLLNTGLAGEAELPWEVLEDRLENGESWRIRRIEGLKKRVNKIRRLAQRQHWVVVWMMDVQCALFELIGWMFEVASTFFYPLLSMIGSISFLFSLPCFFWVPFLL